MQHGAAEAPFRHLHLLRIEGLSPYDINQFLDQADGYVELNRQGRKEAQHLARAHDHQLFLRELDARPFNH
jgi:hypothetical protein